MDTPANKNGSGRVVLPEESAEDLYENAPCGYISTLPNGTIVKVNQTFLTWTGYTREQLMEGKRFQELLGIGGQIFHETHYAPLVRMQGFANEINFELMRRDGQPLPVLVNTVLKRDEQGQPLFLRTTLFNIADRKNYERELVLARKKAEEAAKAKADFLSMMSHEIRTPMNAIIGLSHLLRQSRLPGAQQRYADILHTSSENLLGLLNNILDYSKMEAGKVTLEERNFNLRQLIQSIFHGLHVKAEEKHLALLLELDAAVPPWLLGDPVKLGQVLTNLLSNALKFTEKGSVTLGVRARELLPDGISLEFEVRDTGIGVAPEALSRIFEEFTQASYEINQKYGGSGLGLAICQQLLGLHGSKLQVQSQLGQGTRFTFPLRLRLGLPEREATGSAPGLPDRQRLRGVTVLVAEDNAVNVFVLTQFLRKWGVDFTVVENGRLALQKLQERAFDVVLMDLQMPEMTGYEATRTLRALPAERFRQVPILALTASSRLGVEERLDISGFTDFVGKPFRPEDLFAKLALYSGRSQLTEPSSEPGTPSPPGEERAAARPRFSLEKFRKMAEGDRHALLELSTLAIHNVEKAKRDFQLALQHANLEDFEFHAHRMQMTLELLETHALWDELQKGRDWLTSGPPGETAIQGVIEHIHAELEALVVALKDEVRTVAASLSIVEGM